MSLVVNQTTFNQEVLKSATPVLVNFWAPWCGVCRLVSPMLAELHAKWNGSIKLVDVNADENLKLANAYRLTNLPTVLLFDQGNICCRIDHFHNREDLRVAAADLQATLEAVMASYSCSTPV